MVSVLEEGGLGGEDGLVTTFVSYIRTKNLYYYNPFWILDFCFLDGGTEQGGEEKWKGNFLVRV